MRLGIAVRQRWREWPASLAFVLILAAAASVAGAWLAVALPFLRGSTVPFPHSERLFAVESVKMNVHGGLGWQTIEDLRSAVSVEAIAGFRPRTWGFQTERQGHVEVVLSQQVTPEFFRVLGVDADVNGVWVSHATAARFSLDAGRTVWINDVASTITGVLPEGFEFPANGETPDLYIPLNRADFWKERGVGALDTIVRLKPGVSQKQSASELDARAKALGLDFQIMPTKLGLFLLGSGRLQLIQWLLAAVVVLLLISIANASGVWLAQWLKQQRNAAIKRALGSSVSRIWLEQFTQAGILAVLSAVLGIAGSITLLKLMRLSALTGPELARFELWNQKVNVDLGVAFTIAAVAGFASLMSTALPLLAVSQKAGRLGNSSARVRLVLAVVQLTLTGVLAYSGIGIAHNVQRLMNADRGFRTDQILVSGIGVPEARYDTDEKMIRFHQNVIQQLRQIPGVLDAAGGTSLPVSTFRTAFQLDDDRTPKADQPRARIGAASEGLLRLLEIPLLRGRTFEDRLNGPRVALVNEAFVRRYMGSLADPIGHRIRFGFYNGNSSKSYMDHRIIGVIGNTRNRDLALDQEPQIVINSDQMAFEGFHYFMRSSLPAESLREAIAQAVWSVDPAIERVGVRPLSSWVEASLISRRALEWVLSLFAGISVAIVGFGLASSLTATFMEMTRELGIRSALGATPGRLAVEATRWGALAVLGSCMLSLPSCLAMESLMPGGFDKSSWFAACLVLGGIGIAAGAFPAMRAARIDPAAVLRGE